MESYGQASHLFQVKTMTFAPVQMIRPAAASCCVLEPQQTSTDLWTLQWFWAQFD